MRSGRHRHGRNSSGPAKTATGLIGITAVALAVGLAPSAAAAPATPQITPEPDAKPHSAGSGGNSGSFDEDQADDILARNASTGALRVYPHRDAGLNGTTTFGKPVTVLAGDARVFRWIGQGDFNNDQLADVAGITAADGRLLIALNKGGLAGENTLADGYTSSFGWNTTDLVFAGDVNGDGFDDMLARRKGTNQTFAYLNNANAEKPGFKSPLLLAETAPGVIDQQLADFTGDSQPDLLSVKSNGELHLRDYSVGPKNPDGTRKGTSYLIGTGYNTNNAFLVNDVDTDGTPDLVARTSGGVLQAYVSGEWNAEEPTELLGDPVAIGKGWNSNDVIS